jgi:hypothetical protein
MIAAALAMLLAAAPTPTAKELPGLYVIDQMEMGGALELQPGGHFRYQLDYGAVSESAEGDWKFDGKTVRLTSNPMPREPGFALVSDDPAPAGELYVAVQEDPQFGTWSPLTVELKLDGMDRPVLAYAGDDGRVDAPAGHRIETVAMMVPVYETAGEPVRLSPERGHRLLFRLEPNDMGTAALRDEPLTVEHSAMIMHRYDAEIIFRRAKP